MNIIAFVLAHLKSATFFTLLFTLIFSCNPKPTNKKNKNKPPRTYALSSPAIDNIYSLHDTVHFEISALNHPITPDSVHIMAEGKLLPTQTSDRFDFPCEVFMSKFGHHNLRIKIFYSDSLSQIIASRIIILPDEPPRQLKYKIIEQIPHNPESSTQGLVFYENKLFEGTGQRGKSKLMKNDPVSGKVLLERNLGKDLFGEGIAILDNKIFQLTYKSMLGFIYDLESFEQIREFDLQTAEGWGLTSDGQSLIVSDGSSLLYFFDPVYFSQLGELEVCDNRGIVSGLNELEYVDEKIWANVYGEKYILQIDAQNGKVIGKLDLTGIFPKNIPDDYNHVLNGIAYNANNNSYYITGKLWPVLFRIVIIP